MATLRWGASTDTGLVRTANEDAFVVREPVFAVADGMGGHLAGEVASEMAVAALKRRLSVDATLTDVATIVEAVRTANLEINDAASASPDRRGMGTTLTVLAVVGSNGGERLALVNVGDSRAYVLRDGRLQQLSIDHSYVQELITSGQLDADEARSHPHRNIVTRALGIDRTVQIDAWTLPLVTADRFLLCSDGLVDEVLDETIAELLGSIDDPQRAAEQLVATANRHGGRDNTTVVVVDVVAGGVAPDEELDVALEPHWADGEGEVDALGRRDPDRSGRHHHGEPVRRCGDGRGGQAPARRHCRRHRHHPDAGQRHHRPAPTSLGRRRGDDDAPGPIGGRWNRSAAAVVSPFQ